MADAPELLISIATSASIYALMALSFLLILRPTGIVNFATGGWAMLGAFFAVNALVSFKLPYPVAFVAILGAAAVVAWVTERLAVRPLAERAASQLAVILVLLAMDIVYREGAVWIYGTANRYVPPAFGSGRIAVGPFAGSPQAFFIIAVTAVVFAGAWFFFERTVQGKAFQAVAIDRMAASLMGINLARVTGLSFAAAGAAAALAGALQAPLTTASYLLGPPLLIKGFSALVIGGIGRVEGALLGSFVLAAVEKLMLRYAPIPSGFSIGVPLLLLIVFLLVRPSGLLKAPGAA